MTKSVPDPDFYQETSFSDVEELKQILINKKTDISQEKLNQMLGFAIYFKNLDAIKVFIKNGANINQCCTLIDVLRLRDSLFIKELINFGFDVFSKDEDDYHVTFYAARFSDLAVFKLVSDISDEIHDDCLSVATMNYKYEIIEYLLTKNNINKNQILLAIDFANSDSDITALELLLDSLLLIANSLDVINLTNDIKPELQYILKKAILKSDQRRIGAIKIKANSDNNDLSL